MRLVEGGGDSLCQSDTGSSPRGTGTRRGGPESLASHPIAKGRQVSGSPEGASGTQGRRCTRCRHRSSRWQAHLVCTGRWRCRVVPAPVRACARWARWRRRSAVGFSSPIRWTAHRTRLACSPTSSCTWLPATPAVGLGSLTTLTSTTRSDELAEWAASCGRSSAMIGAAREPSWARSPRCRRRHEVCGGGIRRSRVPGRHSRPGSLRRLGCPRPLGFRHDPKSTMGCSLSSRCSTLGRWCRRRSGIRWLVTRQRSRGRCRLLRGFRCQWAARR